MEATFQPAVAPGSSVDSAVSGIEAGQSMMMRASQLRQQAQMEQMRQNQLEEQQILMPVIRAIAQADQLTAVSSIANAARIQDLRGQAAAVSKPANDEFLDAMQLADFNSKATALAGLQAKYQWMSLIPEYKGFVDTINEERIKAHGSAIADANMERQLEQSQTNYDRAVEVANINAGARTAVADVNADVRRDVATTVADSRRDVAVTGADARKEAVSGSMARTEVRGDLQAAIEADKEAAKFSANGNETEAAEARGRAQAHRESAKLKANPPTPAGEAFTIPNVTDAKGKKLYNPPAQPGEPISISQEVRKPEQIIEALQQAVDAGDMSEDEARATLEKLGFKRKGK